MIRVYRIELSMIQIQIPTNLDNDYGSTSLSQMHQSRTTPIPIYTNPEFGIPTHSHSRRVYPGWWTKGMVDFGSGPLVRDNEVRDSVIVGKGAFGKPFIGIKTWCLSLYIMFSRYKSHFNQILIALITFQSHFQPPILPINHKISVTKFNSY